MSDRDLSARAWTASALILRYGGGHDFPRSQAVLGVVPEAAGWPGFRDVLLCRRPPRPEEAELVYLLERAAAVMAAPGIDFPTMEKVANSERAYDRKRAMNQHSEA